MPFYREFKFYDFLLVVETLFFMSFLMWYTRRKLTNSGVFELQSTVTFDLSNVWGRSKVLLKAETSCFFMPEISTLLGTMRQTYKGKNQFVGFQKIRITSINLRRVINTYPHLIHFINNRVLTSKNAKTNIGYDYLTGIGRF